MNTASFLPNAPPREFSAPSTKVQRPETSPIPRLQVAPHLLQVIAPVVKRRNNKAHPADSQSHNSAGGTMVASSLSVVLAQRPLMALLMPIGLVPTIRLNARLKSFGYL